MLTRVLFDVTSYSAVWSRIQRFFSNLERKELPTHYLTRGNTQLSEMVWVSRITYLEKYGMEFNKKVYCPNFKQVTEIDVLCGPFMVEIKNYQYMPCKSALAHLRKQWITQNQLASSFGYARALVLIASDTKILDKVKDALSGCDNTNCVINCQDLDEFQRCMDDMVTYLMSTSSSHSDSSIESSLVESPKRRSKKQRRPLKNDDWIEASRNIRINNYLKY